MVAPFGFQLKPAREGWKFGASMPVIAEPAKKLIRGNHEFFSIGELTRMSQSRAGAARCERICLSRSAGYLNKEILVVKSSHKKTGFQGRAFDTQDCQIGMTILNAQKAGRHHRPLTAPTVANVALVAKTIYAACLTAAQTAPRISISALARRKRRSSA
jgi:hypothetical protein